MRGRSRLSIASRWSSSQRIAPGRSSRTGISCRRASNGAALDCTILALNRDQARLSTASELVVVPGATHASLATSERDAERVVEAIRTVVARVRAANGIPGK